MSTGLKDYTTIRSKITPAWAKGPSPTGPRPGSAARRSPAAGRSDQLLDREALALPLPDAAREELDLEPLLGQLQRGLGGQRTGEVPAVGHERPALGQRPELGRDLGLR